jgi:MoxR-like ATPase
VEKEEAKQIARGAVDELAKDRGLDATFPFDAIWPYGSGNLVPSTLRPGRSRELINDGYLEKTGTMVNASSSARAGSLTPEYRLGPHYRHSAAAVSDVVSTGAAAPAVAKALKDLEAAMVSRGFIITAAELANFYLALASSPLLILAGISGTGKSRLPRLFAELTQSSFLPIPVKPQWSDNSDLFGYTPSLNPEQFVTGKFTEVAARAVATADQLYLVLLDEMNLAAVEHYFSDFLSVIETRRRQDGEVITDALPLDLPPPGTPDSYSELRGLSLPANLRVVGTANMDETTHSFSPKVLDRAFSIEFDDPDLAVFASERSYDSTGLPSLAQLLLDKENPVTVDEVYSSSSNLFDCIAALLEEVKEILKPAGISFGYRSRNDICMYMYFWQKFDLASVLSPTAAMDFCFMQKILPKLGGTGEQLAESLRALLAWLRTDEIGDATDRSRVDPCASRPWERSAQKVQRMIDRLEAEGATTYWGT